MFAAKFADLREARDARRTARERARAPKPKPPKPRLLPIRPVDPRLVALAAKLVWSTADPAFDTVFDEAKPDARGEPVFYVVSIDEVDGTKRARVVASAPAPGGDAAHHSAETVG